MEYALLGPLEVRDNGRSLPLGGARQRALLALLLVEANRVVSRDRVIDELWGDAPPKSAVKIVQVYVSRLRKLLPQEALVTRSPGYVFELEPEALDLCRFERLFGEGRDALPADAARAASVLREALGLWRGSALAEFASEPFARIEGARLEDLRLSALEERIEADLALGRHADLIGELRTSIVEHPYRERLRGQLMLALYRCGRQAEALDAYRAARHALVDGLGIEPGAALQRLEQQILNQDEELAGPHRFERTAGNLPVAAWPLIGRTRELGEIRRLVLDGVRLLTLTGTGGTGKTRLALQAAAELADIFGDGVFFVELAPLRDLPAVRAAIATALDLPADDDLSEHLKQKRLLLLLDNAEHLHGVEQVVQELLAGVACVLVTSRAPLHLSAEREFPVDPLPEKDAVELFVARAASVGRRIEPDATVSAICHRLDTLPLAVELAAARTKLLSPTAILDRLDQRLSLLAGGAHDLPERQQTLRATIAWSYDLLDESERAAFRRLAVFRGTCSISSAEAVTGTSFDEVASLVDRSLLKPVDDDRLLMLDTLREYARERLDDAGEAESYALRHARHYLELLEAIAPVLRGPRTTEFLDSFDRDEDNLRAALETLTEVDVSAAARLAALLAPYWTLRGRFREGRDRLRSLGTRSDLPAALRAGVLEPLSDISYRIGELDEAESAGGGAVALAEEAGDRPILVRALLDLAWIARGSDDAPRAVSLGERAVAEALAADDEDLHARARWQLGRFLLESGRIVEARELLEQTVSRYRALGDRVNEMIALESVAAIDTRLGDFESALAKYTEAVTVLRKLGNPLAMHAAAGVAFSLLALGSRGESRVHWREVLESAIESDNVFGMTASFTGIAFTAAESDDERAARLIGAARKIQRRHGIVLDIADTEFEKAETDRLATGLGEQAFEREKKIGATLPLSAAAELARELAGLTPN